ncbi:hypothetical protein OFB61_25340, partial [Escherichia coli]|nr:hypothetical protein [Escherichia coli]
MPAPDRLQLSGVLPLLLLPIVAYTRKLLLVVLFSIVVLMAEPNSLLIATPTTGFLPHLHTKRRTL